MISFRFHLVSIVAVLLALAIGITLGSGFVGEALLEDTEGRIRAVERLNAELNAQNDELQRQLDQSQEFAVAVKPWLTQGSLQDRDVIMIAFDGTGESLLEAAVTSVEEAGGDVVTMLSFTDKMDVASRAEREELSLILGVTTAERDELHAALGRRLGAQLSSTAAGRGTPEIGSARLAQTISALQSAGYIGVEPVDPDRLVPQGSSFLMLLGGDERPPAASQTLATDLLRNLSAHGVPVVVGESDAETWDLLRTIRESDDLTTDVSTVDHAETTAAQVAMVLALEREDEGLTGHFGWNDGASAPLPEPESISGAE